MDQQTIHQGLAALADADQDVAQALQTIATPKPRIRPVGFDAFVSTIVSQQISTEAAKAILGRVKSLVPTFSAEALLAVEDQALRNAGLSFRKIDYVKSLAAAVAEGRFDIEALTEMSDSDAIDAITAQRGFGRWSAEIYLMFSLHRQDIFPADDLALQVALGRLKKLPNKPTPKQSRQLVEHWAPWRSVGSLFLWEYYRGAPM